MGGGIHRGGYLGTAPRPQPAVAMVARQTFGTGIDLDNGKAGDLALLVDQVDVDFALGVGQTFAHTQIGLLADNGRSASEAMTAGFWP